MRAEEVTKILGPPTFTGIIESSKIPSGWDRAWKTDYKEMLKKYDRFLFYNYHTGIVNIDVCFDLNEKRVVYLSIFFSTE